MDKLRQSLCMPVGSLTFVITVLSSMMLAGCRPEIKAHPRAHVLDSIGILSTGVYFHRMEAPQSVSLRSSKIRSPDGKEYLVSDWGHGTAKAGYAVSFDVDATKIEESVQRIDCKFAFTVGGVDWTLYSAFVRDSERRSGWRALREEMRIVSD